MTSIIGSPDPISTVNGIGSWASAIFTSWELVGLIIAGIAIGALVIAAIMHVFYHGFGSLVYGPHHLNSERQDMNALRSIELHKRYMRVKSGRGIMNE